MIGGELEPEQEYVMGMDRRLRPGSKPLRNQCRGTGVQPQVYKSKKTFKEREEERGKERSRNRGKTNCDHSFPLSQLKTPLRSVLVFNLQKESSERKTNVNRAQRSHRQDRPHYCLASQHYCNGASSLHGHTGRHYDISRINKLI